MYIVETSGSLIAIKLCSLEYAESQLLTFFYVFSRAIGSRCSVLDIILFGLKIYLLQLLYVGIPLPHVSEDGPVWTSVKKTLMSGVRLFTITAYDFFKNNLLCYSFSLLHEENIIWQPYCPKNSFASSAAE